MSFQYQTQEQKRQQYITDINNMLLQIGNPKPELETKTKTKINNQEQEQIPIEEWFPGINFSELEKQNQGKTNQDIIKELEESLQK